MGAVVAQLDAAVGRARLDRADGGHAGRRRARPRHGRGERRDRRAAPARCPPPRRGARRRHGRVPRRTRPGLEVVHGDARDLGKLLAERGVMHVDAVVCGLPWALFDEPTQHRVLTEVGHAIGPTGAFTTFAYLPGMALPAARRFRRTLRATVRGGAHHRARVAQHAARVRLRVPQAASRGRASGELHSARRRARSAALGRLLRGCARGPPCRCWPPSRCTCSSTRPWSDGSARCRWPGLAVAARAVRAGHEPAQLPVLRHDGPHRAAVRRRSARRRRRRGRAGHVARARRRRWSCWCVGQLVARPVAEALGNGGAIAEGAVSWLRVALFGAPLLLVTLAGNGWMRGVQDTARPLRYVLAGNGVSAVGCVGARPRVGALAGLGLVGSAWANVVGQCCRRRAVPRRARRGRAAVRGALARRCCARSSPWAATSWPAASRSRPASCPRRRSPPGSGRRWPPPTRSCCSSGRSWRSCSTPWRSRRSRWSVRRWAAATRGRARVARGAGHALRPGPRGRVRRAVRGAGRGAPAGVHARRRRARGRAHRLVVLRRAAAGRGRRVRHRRGAARRGRRRVPADVRRSPPP